MESNRLEEKLNEAEKHIKPYMDDASETEELREMCKNCECYCGLDHNYEECRNQWCYKFWLAYVYLSWEDSYE